MSHTPSEPTAGSGHDFTGIKLDPSGLDALSIKDLASAFATRKALLAALNRLPEIDPDDQETANAHNQVWDMVDAAECFILDHTPVTGHDAAVILEVLLDAEPQRSDGRDQDALGRIRDLLLSETFESR